MPEQGPDNTVAILSIIVSGSVIVLAALIAAVAAHYREKGSAQRDAEQLDRQLAHDLQRLREQFEHERALSDMQEKRRVLDATIDAVEGVAARVSDLPWTQSEEARDTAKDRLGAQLVQASLEANRLLVRFGMDHDIVVAFRPLLPTLRDRFKAVVAFHETEVEATRLEHLQTFESAAKEYQQALRVFVREAQKVGGVDT